MVVSQEIRRVALLANYCKQSQKDFFLDAEGRILVVYLYIAEMRILGQVKRP